jgi:hypothetical protein
MTSHPSSSTYLKRGAFALFAIAMLVPAASAASANNDPHRVALPAGPVDFPVGVCSFPLHVVFPTANEYAKISTLPDGSTVYKVTGALQVTITNTDTGKSVTENASGPGTQTVSADGSTIAVDEQGSSVWYSTNGADFGLPNLMLISGPYDFTMDTSTLQLLTVTRTPNVKADLCAELS